MKEHNPPLPFAHVCSFLGWLGGELVTHFGVGVHEVANVDSPTLRPR